jgi:hypothetical protein
MAINWIDDVGAPAVVTAINIGARASTAKIGNVPVADVATYGMFALGYIADWQGWGGKYQGFLKNLGIAAAPLAMEKLYNMIKGTTVTSRPMSRLSRYPGPAAETPFTGVRLT